MQQKPSITRIFYAYFVGATLAYIGVTLTTPLVRTAITSTLSDFQLRLIQASFIIPIVLIWWAAVYGATTFKKYAQLIKGSSDGQALNVVANGLLVLTGGLIAGSLWTTIAAGFWPPPSHTATKIIVSNYLTILFPLLAFYVMVRGAVGLVQLSKAQSAFKWSILVSLVWFILFSSLYVGLVFSGQYRNFSPSPSITSFWLPDSLLITTIIIPNILVWALGIMTATALLVYVKSAKGILYKQAIRQLGVGLLSVIIFSILVQMWAAVGTVWAYLNLAWILIVIYIIVLLYAIGYLYIASGARRLRQIEEVK